MITIVAIGKKHEDWVSPGVERYQKRLQKPFDVNWILLPHSSLEGTAARQEESERILSRLPDAHTLYLLDERGQQLISEDLSRRFDADFSNGKSVCLIIGGAYGVDETILARSNFVLSLSKLVMPHQLVRLVLIEQIYRAQQIRAGSSYHHV